MCHTTNVESKTKELCEAILQQLQASGIRKRIDTFLADTSARTQYEAVMNEGGSNCRKKTAQRPKAGKHRNRGLLRKNAICC